MEPLAVRTLLAVLACPAAVFVGGVIFASVEFLSQHAEQAAAAGMVRPVVGRLPLHWTLPAAASLFGLSVLAGLVVHGRKSHGRRIAGVLAATGAFLGLAVLGVAIMAYAGGLFV